MGYDPFTVVQEYWLPSSAPYGSITDKKILEKDLFNKWLNYQAWTRRIGGNYTPMFIDIHDNSNQREGYRYCVAGSSFMDYVNDEVCLPNIKKIEEIAFSSVSMSEVKRKLKKIAPGHIIQDPVLVGPAGPIGFFFTEQDVDKLFEFY